MPSEHFTGYTLTKVKNAIKNGVDKAILFRDKNTSGLAIKVTPTGGSWYISTRDLNRQIVPFSSCGLEDLPALRALVVELKKEHAKGRDVDPMIEAFASGHSVSEAKHLHDVAHGEGVVWEVGRDAFLAWVGKHRKPDTARGYKSALGATPGLAGDFEPIAGKPIASITSKDLYRIQNRTLNRCERLYGEGHGVRQATLTLQALKSAFDFFIKKDYGIENNPTIGVKAPGETSKVYANEGVEPLTQLQLGALWYALLACPNESVRLALQLQLLTGQRRFDPTAALKNQYQFGGPYSCVWSKADKVHHWRKLPLPPVATSVVEQAFRLSRSDNDYLFPKQRARRTGDDMGGHINERTISKHIENMRKPGGVFENLPFSISTHDLRKAFTSVMAPKMGQFHFEGQSLRKEDTKIITHLNEGRDDVSQKVYDLNAYLDLKLEILSWWENFIMDGYRMYLAQQEAKQAA